jgi:mRNA interferase HigB
MIETLMRIIARRTLREFVDGLAGKKDQAAVKAALNAWFDEVSRATWKNTAEVKRRYATASIVTAERIVFNIKGNDYRLWFRSISRRASLAHTRITTRST